MLHFVYMFTGIITHKGEITEIKTSKSVLFTISTSTDFATDLKIGDSICVNGACLTAINIEKNIKKPSFELQLMPETMTKTAFDISKVGDEINLEKAMTFNQRLDGHIVQGHVDGVGKINQYIQEEDKWILSVKIPQDLRKYIAYKGSVCINGVSLTVSKKTEDGLEVSLITHTLENTNLKSLKINDLVNIEIDIIARYIENMISK